MNNKILQPQLINLVAQASDMSKKQTEALLKAFFNVISDALQMGETVRIKRLGTFKASEVGARKSVNVATGEAYEIPAHKKVTFVPARDLADEVNRDFAWLDIVEVSEDVSSEDLNNINVDDYVLPTEDDVDNEQLSEEIKEEIKEPIEVPLAAAVLSPTQHDSENQLIQGVEQTETNTLEENRKENNIESEIGENETIDLQTEENLTQSDAEVKVTEIVETEAEIPEVETPDNETVTELPPVEIAVSEANPEGPDLEASVAVSEPEETASEESIKDFRLEETPVLTTDEQKVENEEEANHNGGGESGLTGEKLPFVPIKELEEIEYKSRKRYRKSILWAFIAAIAVMVVGFLLLYFALQKQFDHLFKGQKEVPVAEIVVLPDTVQDHQEKDSVNDTAETKESPEESEKEEIQEEKIADTPASDILANDAISTTRYLTTMAKEYYGDFNLWPYIYLENEKHLGHPDRIKPGTKIVVPYLSKYKVNPKNPDDIKKAKELGVEIYARFQNKSND